MLYIILLALIILIAAVYIIPNRNERDEENIMEEVPSLKINKEELKKHAIEISNYSKVTKRTNCRRMLIKSLDSSYRKILDGYDYLDIEAKNKNEVIQAADWLLDNLYLIQKEYKDIRHNMPEEYYKKLPVISKGSMKCYPRVYYLAVQLVAHTDGKIDEETIETFINSYQSNTVLTSGELWALPAMIKIALIQNISKITDRIVFIQKERKKGDSIAERIIDASINEKIEDEIKKLSAEQITFTPKLIERLLKVIRDNGVENPIVYKWIDELLDSQETSAEKIIIVEHQKEISYQASIGNSINSIREVEAINWRDSFEKLSYVENILRKDPLHIYEEMDFQSRDYYRHYIERLSRKINMPESFIAKKAIECAEDAMNNHSLEEYKKHVGYYIVDYGVQCLKNKIKFDEAGINTIDSKARSKNVSFYIGSILLGTIVLTAAIVSISFYYDTAPVIWKYIIAALIILIPCSEIIVSTFNWNISKIVKPRYIPKIEFKGRIPEEFSTIVIIPTLLDAELRVKNLINDLEVYYLANKEENLYFALLGDFKDSDKEHEEEDDTIVKTALGLVKKLNEKYSSSGEDIFYFFNRYRQYNSKEGIWLGWERKRGKLVEFNNLIRGDKDTSYNVISGDINNLSKVKYIITLDADTQLPRDSAKKLVGAMAHVLNRPYVDNAKKKVIRGHGLMQPRVSVGSLSANKTLFSRIFSGETGMDLYTSAVSDVYEDLFDEGIFTGKGIYDVDVFISILKDEIPENSVLSHDLLEGSYTRAALVTDIELVDGYPAYYNSSSKRLHRWVRGDWQLLPWLFRKSPLNSLSKWKIVDNMRRSLLAPSIIILVIVSLIIFENPDEWLIVAFIALLCPIFFDVSEIVVSPIRGISLSGKISSWKIAVEQFFLIFCFLPYQAYLMLDAIVRTLYRLFISKKHLLQWQTAADVEANSGRKLKDFLASMWIGSLISVFIIFMALRNSEETVILMLPSCVIWFLSPWIAYNISRHIKDVKEDIDSEQKTLLRRLCRKTWAYFEDFVAQENNWLAPDNYQEDPSNGIATRTSPTNMGMGITSNLVAFDLGYIGILELVERIDTIINNMESLEKYSGHYYNWYDTKTKQPLYPRYISTVDSGNLVGYLWLTNQSLKEYLTTPIFNKNLALGLLDTLKLAKEELSDIDDLNNYYGQITDEINSEKFNAVSWKEFLHELWAVVIRLEEAGKTKKLYWNTKLREDIGKYLKEMKLIFPWLDLITEKTSDEPHIMNKFNNISSNISLINFSDNVDELELQLNELYKSSNENEPWIGELKQLFVTSKREVNSLIKKIEKLREILDNISNNTNFKMLYNYKRQLFSIGYDVERDSLGNSYYDLLASESRQASFVSIAKGEIEQSHWFRLGRAMTAIGKNKSLVSWSGTMFEYFMPLIIMRNYSNTLLEKTYISVVEGQKKYCKNRNVPWGISESAFYYFDVNSNYQYKAFGVPGLGLKRGLVNELVISPYSTIMALQIELQGAINNIKKLIDIGMEGRYGFYEAIDYTKERLAKGREAEIVKCFMVHHEGMSLMALDNVLNNNVLQERFHKIPAVKATELLLQERVPKAIIYDREQQYDSREVTNKNQSLVVRPYDTANTEMPECQLISNGAYSLMITNSGGGYAKKDDMMVYRWREDVTTDNTGMFFYIKNLNSNEYWSSTYEPCKYEGEEYEAIFSLDKVEFKRKDGNLRTNTEITVSNEDNAEVRTISITNNSDYTREIEITSYCEVTLAPYNADLVHPTFGNLFIKTEYLEELDCVIANRRPRAKGQKRPWIMQTVAVEGTAIGKTQCETNRANFIGRGRTLSNPLAMDNDAQLKMTVGAVLDPIISMRVRVTIGKGETCRVAYTTAVADSKEEIIDIAKKYKDLGNVDRAFDLTWSATQLELSYLGIKSTQANMYQSMASKILFLNTSLKKRHEYITNLSKGQSALWTYGISGDVPIVLLIIKEEHHVDLVRQLINAHEYWSTKGLKVDLVVVNLQENSYIQSLQDAVRDLISSSHARDKQNKSGGIFLHNRATIVEEDINLLIAISRLVIYGDKGMLKSQIKDEEENTESTIELLPVESKEYSFVSHKFTLPHLHYFNGIGGFDEASNSYIILLKDYENTPAPWINVISNGNFGFHVSENGVAYTWNKNSRENKLTTWSNDPVIDNEGESVYIRDEITGSIWSISPKPIRNKGEYFIEHGFGYSTFKHEEYGILGEMTMFADINESVKVCRIKLKNNTQLERKLSISYYAKLVLGVTHEQTAQYIFTGFNSEKEYIYARNPYSEHFGKLICYMKALGGDELSFTGDRKEFIGRGGSVEEPKSLKQIKLSNKVGAGYDPCIAENVKVTVAANGEKEITVLFGQEESFENIHKVIEKYSIENKAEEELNKCKAYWKKMLNTIHVETPDKSMDLILNGWLMYQVISCRFWARTAFYQSGGAYGFRDQLQDVMAVSYLNSNITREHIIYSASKQYLQGDVQHWWHPVVESGIRTRFSDDLLWLPYVTIDYIKNTGDYSILEEEAPYLEDEELKEGEDERYNISKVSDKKGTIYEHCIKAIEKSLKFGPHNIPLMGSGDWNDGMSTVGNQGKGESVWLGWFLYSILDKFIDICMKKQDKDTADKYKELKDFIKENLEHNAWDGGWYRRAYFDDGTPLGSLQNDECQIDSLSQSWSVISGAARESRRKEAMEALERNLIKDDKGIVLLLTPAFDKSTLEPGYIKGYVPGVRENGGQYTHASIWVILAMAKMGYNNKAWRTFHMINPINHSKSYLNSQVYKVEPYVMTADVYAVEPHTGRGGWSWYTGAAGWMYRTGIESILGLKFKGEKGFTVEPCVPDDWKSYNIYYTREQCKYNINVVRGEGKGIWLDNNKLEDGVIPILKEGSHEVKVVI
ncbi:GH36-type glycosyl hydrolase domain-containing protein [Clostridium sp. DJ247]|uniref:GH36-type glycosyl hydrolase domain-containing protein n=1 Tax=Clostridium sp. DJ247 TaxID=2726188 RepID=UPI001624BF3E|nr:glucoamylase family protein [Clostridium sp. DJ247]MBC2579722.1 cyclic beta 1-2 glucan synthetase [Clostridium sp. DJ247]